MQTFLICSRWHTWKDILRTLNLTACIWGYQQNAISADRDLKACVLVARIPCKDISSAATSVQCSFAQLVQLECWHDAAACSIRAMPTSWSVIRHRWWQKAESMLYHAPSSQHSSCGAGCSILSALQAQHLLKSHNRRMSLLYRCQNHIREH